jgi:hypothetical protein
MTDENGKRAELAPCPCGRQVELTRLGGKGSTHAFIQCKCGIGMSFRPTFEAAAAEWNKRFDYRPRVDIAFDMIAKANTVTILSLDEMQSVVNRALSGEFDATAARSQTDGGK